MRRLPHGVLRAPPEPDDATGHRHALRTHQPWVLDPRLQCIDVSTVVLQHVCREALAQFEHLAIDNRDRHEGADAWIPGTHGLVTQAGWQCLRHQSSKGVLARHLVQASKQA